VLGCTVTPCDAFSKRRPAPANIACNGLDSVKDRLCRRHGGVVPKTLSDEDAKAASQAAIKWQAKH
jgi:hypothetical protein